MDNIDIIFDELKINIVPKKAKRWNTMPENVNDVKNLARILQNYQFIMQEEKVR